MSVAASNTYSVRLDASETTTQSARMGGGVALLDRIELMDEHQEETPFAVSLAESAGLATWQSADALLGIKKQVSQREGPMVGAREADRAARREADSVHNTRLRNLALQRFAARLSPHLFGERGDAEASAREDRTIMEDLAPLRRAAAENS